MDKYNQIKLSDAEKVLLAYVELRADVEREEIREQTGLRMHTIHYLLHKLTDQGLIKKIPFVDMRKLGYDDYAIYFSLASQEKEKQQELMNFLNETPDVTLVAEFGGDYQYGIGLYCRRMSHFHNFLQQLNSIVPGIFFEKSINVRMSFTRFNRAYLSDDVARHWIRLKPTDTIEELSHVDRRILAHVHQDGGLSWRQTAADIDVPASTVRYRMNHLIQKKVINSFTYFIDSTLYGATMYELLISVKGFTSTISKDLFSFCKKERHVIHFLECIGEWDFEIGVEVMDTQTVRDIVEKLYEEFGHHIQTIKVIPFFRFRKYSFFPLDKTDSRDKY